MREISGQSYNVIRKITVNATKHKNWFKVRLQPAVLLVRVVVSVLSNSDRSPAKMMVEVESNGPLGGLVLLWKFRSSSGSVQ